VWTLVSPPDRLRNARYTTSPSFEGASRGRTDHIVGGHNHGKRLDRDALDDLRHKAHRAYEANSHIFEDEYEALTALGAVPLNRLHEDALEIA
jgi:hypothetical protein